MYLLDTRWQQMHNAMRVREGTVTITGSHPHSRWSFCAPGHRMLSQYQASYPAILDIATSLSLTKLLGWRQASPWQREGRCEETTMWRRTVGCIVTLILSLCAASHVSDAQQWGKVHRIG